MGDCSLLEQPRKHRVVTVKATVNSRASTGYGKYINTYTGRARTHTHVDYPRVYLYLHPRALSSCRTECNDPSRSDCSFSLRNRMNEIRSRVADMKTNKTRGRLDKVDERRRVTKGSKRSLYFSLHLDDSIKAIRQKRRRHRGISVPSPSSPFLQFARVSFARADVCKDIGKSDGSGGC